MDKNEKLAMILQDEAFGEACQNVDTVEQMQALIAQYGLELTTEEVEGLCAQAAIGSAEGELDAETLENVSGGVAMGVYYLVAKLTGKALAAFLRSHRDSFGGKKKNR